MGKSPILWLFFLTIQFTDAQRWWQTTEYPDSSSHMNTPIRLVGGYDSYSGRVEVYYRGQWGTICDDSFNRNDLHVICRMLGMYRGSSYGVIYTNAGYFGPGSGSIMIDDLQCSGHESDVLDCRSQTWLTNDCSHSEDVGIDCHGMSTQDYPATLETTTDITSERSRSNDVLQVLMFNSIKKNHMNSTTIKCLHDAAFNTVRLTNRYYGRVEIYRSGEWMTVCGGHLTHNDVMVICKQVGYYHGPSYGYIYSPGSYGQGYSNNIVQYLHCNGYESSISQCSIRSYSQNSYCRHSQDAAIECRAYRNDGTTVTSGWYDQTTASYNSVRLLGGSGHSGRVEIYHNGEWMTVCINTLDHSEIMSICRSLGHFYGYDYGTRYGSGTYGQGHSNHIVHDLSCNGYVSDLSQCRIGFSTQNSRCYHSQDAGINCYGYRNDMTTVDPYVYEQSTASENTVRLVGGSGYSGRVEILHNGEWMTVCANTLDHSDIMSICRSVGHYNGYNYGTSYGSGTYGQGHSSHIVHDLSCNGYVSSMSQCHIGSSAQNSRCYHSQDAGINCYGYFYDMTTVDPYSYEQSTASENAVRLVGGSGYSGRVEIYHNNEWMTVCANTLDHSDIMSICRSVGHYYGYDRGVERGSWYYGQGTSYSIVHYMNCNGYGYVSQCGIQSSPRNSYCSHSQDAGIDCSEYYYEETTTVYPYWYKQTTEGSVLENAITVSCNEYGWDININMYRLQQQYPAARADAIYLGENTCMGNDNGYNVHFSQGLHQCLTSQMIRNDILVYRNQLIYAERDPAHPFIIRSYNWTVDVECDVMRNESSSGHLHHDSGASSSNHQVSGTSHYAVNMSFFSDPNFRYQIHGYPLTVNVGDNVYVKVFSATTDWTIKMKVHTCYTTPGNSETSYQKYYIIKNGCEVDENTHIISQSTHETRFVFKDFEYTSNHEGININCDATFCPSSDYSSTCSQTCNPVIRRRNLPDFNESKDSLKDFQEMKDTTEEPKGTVDDVPSYETTEMP